MTGGGGPVRVASSAARVSLSTRSARASGWRARRVTSLGLAEQQAGLRAAEQLVAAGSDQLGAGAQPGVGVGLVGENRVAGASRPEPMSPTTGTPRPGELGRRSTDAVKPSIR